MVVPHIIPLVEGVNGVYACPIHKFIVLIAVHSLRKLHIRLITISFFLDIHIILANFRLHHCRVIIVVFDMIIVFFLLLLLIFAFDLVFSSDHFTTVLVLILLILMISVLVGVFYHLYVRLLRFFCIPLC